MIDTHITLILLFNDMVHDLSGDQQPYNAQYWWFFA